MHQVKDHGPKEAKQFIQASEHLFLVNSQIEGFCGSSTYALVLVIVTPVFSVVLVGVVFVLSFDPVLFLNQYWF